MTITAIAKTEERRATGKAVLVIDWLTMTVTVNGQPIDVSKKERELLIVLAEHPSKVYSKSELLGGVWEWAKGAGSTRTLDSHACHLRTKLAEALGHEGVFVLNKWGEGYSLVAPGRDELVALVEGGRVEDPHDLAEDAIRRLRDVKTDVHQLASLLDEQGIYGVEAITAYGAVGALGDVIERLIVVKDRVV